MTTETYYYDCSVLSKRQIADVKRYLGSKYVVNMAAYHQTFPIYDIVDMVNDLGLPIDDRFRPVYDEVMQEMIESKMDLHILMSTKHEININLD